MIQDLLSQIRRKMDIALDHFTDEIKSVRTGRAQAALVEGVMVQYYGAKTPLKAVATIQIPDAHTIIIQPWDPGALRDIEQAIREAQLGLEPTNDGRLIRLSIPPLTSERRVELVKLLHKMGEEARVILRGIRKNAWEGVQEMHKTSDVTEDEKYRSEEQLNKLIDEFNGKIEELVKHKETDILTV